MAQNQNAAESAMEIVRLSSQLAKDPESKVFMPLAEEYGKVGMWQEAAGVLEAGLERYPGFITAMVALGRAYDQIGQATKAKAILEESVKLSPENLRAHRTLIKIYTSQGLNESALQSCAVILAVNPRDEEALSAQSALGRSLKQQKEPERPKPATPGTSNLPAQPATPGMSNLPAQPATPGTSNLPAQPATPGMSNLPAQPATPGMSNLPAQSATAPNDPIEFKFVRKARTAPVLPVSRPDAPVLPVSRPDAPVLPVSRPDAPEVASTGPRVTATELMETALRTHDQAEEQLAVSDLDPPAADRVGTPPPSPHAEVVAQLETLLGTIESRRHDRDTTNKSHLKLS